MTETLSIVKPGVLECIGDALQARLHLIFPPTRFEHAAVPARMDSKGWNRLIRRTPFVGLGWVELENAAKQPARLFHGHSSWTVFLVTKNQAGSRQLYWGDAQGAGLFAMVRAAVAMLHGHVIPGIGAVMVRKAANVYAEGWDADDMAMAMVDVSVKTELPLCGQIEGVALHDWLQSQATWSFAPAGEAEVTDVTAMGAGS